jgi:sodium transport system ATP-binding protein
LIEVQDIHRSFGDVKAVQGVSFTAPDGQVTGLLGPNGAGKSTTLRILYTVMSADSGRAAVDGHTCSVDDLVARERMGVLPHGAGIYPRLTARENVRYFGRLYGMDGDALETRIEALIERLGMEEFADRRTEGFSQGQRVKTALARALINDPQNIVLDEPTNGLDVMATRALRTLIRELRDEGRCVLFSSHVMQEVAALCDNIVIISHGVVAAEGSPEALRERADCDDLEDAFVKLIGDAEGLQ